MKIRTFLPTRLFVAFLVLMVGIATQAPLVRAADTTKPSVPTNLTASNIQVTQITLKWNASTDNVGVTGYIIKRGSVTLPTVTGTTYTDTGLTPNTTYSYTVSARDAAGNVSNPSTARSAKTLADTTAPSTPTNLTSSNVQTTQVTLTWTASTDNVAVTNYVINRNGAAIATVGAVTTYVSTGLSPNTTYQYTVAAKDAAGNTSSVSSIRSVTTPPDTAAPSVPTNLTSSNVQATQVTLNWTASTDNVAVTNYVVKRGGVTVATVGAVTTYTDTTVSPSTTYSYTVAAKDAAGNTSANSSPRSVTTLALDVTAPTAPTSLRTTSVQQSQIALTWNASTDNVGVTSYVLSRNAVVIATLSGTTTTFTDTGLAPLTTYQYKVVAKDAAGNTSPSSNTLNATTLGDTTPPTAPTNLTSSNVQYTQLTLNWTASTDNVGVTNYVVNRGGVAIATVGAVTTYTDTNLTPGTAYQYTVAAKDAAGNTSANSTARSVSTLADTVKPSTPTNLSSTVQGTQVTLNWTASTDNVAVTNYVINRNGAVLATVGAVTTYTDTTLAPATAYQYTVMAKDAAGNTSAVSNSVNVLSQSSPCTTGGPAGGTYTITVCISAPADGAALTGLTNVTTTVTWTGSPRPAVGTIIYYLDGQYLLTDFNNPTPSVSFQLPSQYFLDGAHALSVAANLSDSFSTSPASIGLTFANGVTTPPVNANTFAPHTPSVTGRPLILAAAGDGADGQSPAVPDRILSWNPDMFLYLGDVYNKGTQTEFYNWYGQSGAVPTFFGKLRNITNPIVGNHEYEQGIAPGYYAYWNMGPATVQNEPRSYYSYNAGGWHFIALNSNVLHSGYLDPGSAEYTWLANDLANNTAVCTIAYFHHPVYNVGPEGYKIAMNAMWTLMANNGVDVILTGHDHDYQRWMPLDANGNPSPTGITQFVAGGGGHGTQQPITTDNRLVTGAYTTPNAFGALRMELNATGMQFQYINQAGSVLDSGAIPCNGASDTTPPSAPTNLTSTSGANVVLNWNASTDSTGIAGYTVYRNGAAIGTTSPGILSYTDYTAQLNNSYSYTVDAFDPAGNHSAKSNTASVTMPISGSYVLNPTADSYVNESSPTFNFGVSTTLRTDLTPIQNSYLRFTLPALSGNVTNATLKVYANGTGTAASGYTVQNTAGGWTETGITFGTAPAPGTIVGTSGSFVRGNWTTVNVTSAITSAGEYNFVMTGNDQTATVYDSREGVNPPQLIITVSSDTSLPSAPTNLTASNVQGTQVTLNWNASTDNVGVTGYTINRNGVALIQVGLVTSYTDTNLAIATPYQYTVTAQDAAGNSSPLSNVLDVTTLSTGTLTPVADSYVDNSLPGSNFGNIAVIVTDSTPIQNGYLRFQVPAFSGNVASAQLRVYANTANLQGYTLWNTSTGWTETGINYSNAPVSIGNSLGSSGPITANTWTQIDVTSLVTSPGEYNFLMTANNATQTTYSSRTGANPPQLIVNLSNDIVPPSVPTNLTISNVQETQVTLNWDASTDNIGVTGYVVTRSGAAPITLGAVTTYTDTGLLPGTAYQYTVAAKDAVGNTSGPSNAANVTTLDTTVPSAPANLTATSIQATQVTLSWDASTDNVGVTGYIVTRSGAAPITLGAVTTYTDTGLTPVTAYQYTVAAKDAAGNTSPVSNTLDVTTAPPSDTTPPSAPTNLTASNVQATQLTLNWTASTDDVGVTGYVVTRSGAAPITLGAVTTYTDTSLTSGTAYQYTVTANDAAGNISAASNMVNVSTLSTGTITLNPVADSYVSDTNVTGNFGTSTTLRVDGSPVQRSYLRFQVPVVAGNITGATLRIHATSSNTQGYTLQSAGTGWTETGITFNTQPSLGSVVGASGTVAGGSWTTVNVTSIVTSAGEYNFAMIPINSTATVFDSREAAANKPELVITVSSDIAPPSTPTNLAASNVQMTQLTLNWDASTDNVGVTSYVIKRGGIVLTTLGAVTTYTDSGLTPNTAYQYTVAAKDAEGNTSGDSSAVNVTTLAAPDTTPPSAPANLRSSNVQATQVTLNWDASTDDVGVTGYVVTRAGAAPVTLGVVTTYSDSGLTPSTAYQYTVVAKDAAGNTSTASNTLDVTTPAAPDTTAPSAPANLTTTDIQTTQVTLSWTASTDNVGVTNYVVTRSGAAPVMLGVVTTYTDSGLTPSTAYQYTVVAKDAAGNTSAVSNTLNVTTLTPGAVGTITLGPTADTFVDSSSPGTNFGSNTALRTTANSGTPAATRNSYLRFQVPALGGSVVSATLKVFATSASTVGYKVFSTTGGWTESGLNWSTASAFGPVGGSLGAMGPFAANTWTQVDVTSLVTTGGEYNLLMTAINTTQTNVAYASRENATIANRPVLVVVVNTPPAAANDSGYSTNQNTALSVPAAGVLANDTDADGNPLTAVKVSDPAHGTVTLNSNGSFTYTPAANYSGSDSFTYKANDGKNNSNTATVSLTVNAVNTPPVAVNDSYSTNQNTALSVPAAGVLANDTDADGNPLTTVLISDAAHGSVALIPNGSFTYTPNTGYSGSDSFTYQAFDGSANSNTATVSLTVNAVNTPPAAVNDSYSTNQNTALSVPAVGVLANDTDADGNPLTAVKVSDPAHGTVMLNSDGSFTYTPNTGYSGGDSFTYKANDGSADSNVATVSLMVNAVNTPPAAANDSYSTNQNTALSVPAVGVLANDTDADGNPLTAVKVSDPAHGTVTLNSDGSFTYTPAANYSGGDSFTYKANDGSADSNVATVSLTVNAVNTPPAAVNDSYSTDEDIQLIVPAVGVLGNDSDLEGNPLAALQVSGPSNGSLTLNSDGSFTYTPNANFNGSDSFTYKVNDGSADSNVATVSITVNPVNDVPVAAADSYSTTPDTALTVPAAGVLANDMDADSNPLTAVKVSDPANGSLILNSDGSFTYTPNTGFNGSDSFTYKANDGSADSDIVTVGITVN